MRFLLRPLRDLLDGLERCLQRGVPGLVSTFTGLLGAWWIYVPVHELLHAFGCELGGGRVWRLEIAPLYGGGLLARWFSFVEAGGEYAGRLAGFDTGGSATVHLLTTGLPFVLTVFPGVWLLRWGARRASGWVYGAGLVLATAPFLSLTGDAYEIGSLLATQLAPWSGPAASAALVGDDVGVVVKGLSDAGATLWLGFASAFVLGAAWAFFTYATGAAMARRLGQAALEPLPRRPRSEQPASPAAPAEQARRARDTRVSRVSRLTLAIVAMGAAAVVYVAATAGGEAGEAAAPNTPPRQTAPQAGRGESPAGEAPQRLRVRVLANFPHDATSYTQGLLWDPPFFVESTGGYGDSLVRRWRPGQVAPQAEVRLPDDVFGEGITAVGETLLQLTWREGVAFLRDRSTLLEKARVGYHGEGWGLCYDGERLIMSDGTSTLTQRDPETLAPLRRVEVRAGSQPLTQLNELECAEGWVFANIYQTDEIARIDPQSGSVSAMIDASGLLTAAERAAGAQVLNGIAYNPESETFYLTGKLWPRLFEVVFEPLAARRPASNPVEQGDRR